MNTKEERYKMLDLSKHGYLCDKQFEASVVAALHTKPVAGAFLFGPAGTGKTYLAETLAKIEGARTFFFQCFPGTREDDLLVKILPDSGSKSGVKLSDGVIVQAVKSVNEGNLTYLILDEWDKTRPSADSFLLDFLQSGRINYNSHSYKIDDFSKLRVFITMNDERELSEPLLRRLPVLHFNYLSSRRVREALELTHKDHPQLLAAVVLYEKTLAAGLSKPATIQELRQLLDAITVLGDAADWDALVYQYITKTDENHTLLKRVESQKTQVQLEERPQLNAKNYEIEEHEDHEETVIERKPALPRLKEVLKINEKVDSVNTDNMTDVLSNAKGIVQLNDHTYNEVAKTLNKLEKSELDKKVDVVNDKIVFKESYTFETIKQAERLFGHEGEILIEHKFTREDLQVLQRQGGWRIVKISDDEILAKWGGGDIAELRWTQDNTEIIVSLQNIQHFQSAFGLDYNLEPSTDWSKRIFSKTSTAAVQHSQAGVRPVLDLHDDDTNLIVFQKVTDYLVALHNHYFDNFDYFISEQPNRFDYSRWLTKRQQLEKVIAFCNEFAELKSQYDFLYIEPAWNASNIVKNQTGLTFALRYNFKKFEEFVKLVQDEYNKTLEHIKFLEAQHVSNS
jgi:MoxR-like ATPase